MPSQKDFGTMKTNIGNEVGDTSATFATRVGVYINNRYMETIRRLRAYDFFENFRTITITATAGTRYYPVPSDFDRPEYIHDTTNNRELEVIYEKELLQRFGSNLSEQAVPIVLILSAEGTLRAQPASATKLKAVSTSTSDTAVNAILHAISGSAEIFETFALSGTSSTQSVNTYDYYLKAGLDTAASGVVTLSYSTGGDTAAVISPGQTETHYKRAGFHYIPAGSYVYDIRYKREVLPLSNTNDYPMVDIADVIELGAKADAWRTKRFFSFANDFEVKYERALDDYIFQRQADITQQFSVVPQDRNDGYSHSSIYNKNV